MAATVLGFVLVLGLTIAGISVAGGTSVVITGASMTPAVPLGSLAIAQPLANGTSVSAGDIVTFAAPNGTFVTHRVVDVLPGTPALLTTKGDTNPHPDPQPTPLAALVGRVTVTVPLARFGLAMLQSPTGILAVASLLGSLLATRRALVLTTSGDHGKRRRFAAARGIGALMLAAMVTSLPVVPAHALFTDSQAVTGNTFATGSW